MKLPGAPLKKRYAGSSVCLSPPATNTATLSNTSITPTVTIIEGTFSWLYSMPIRKPSSVPQHSVPRIKPT